MIRHITKRSLLIGLLGLFALILVFFISLPFFVRPAFLERIVREKVEKDTGLVPTFTRYKFDLLPAPTLKVYSFSLKSSKAENLFIDSEQASFRPSILSLVLGKVELAHVSFRNATIRYLFGNDNERETLSVEHVYADLYGIRSKKPIRFKIKGRFFSSKDNLSLNGSTVIDFSRFNSKNFGIEATGNIHSIEVAQLNKWWSDLPFGIQKGSLSFSGKINKPVAVSELSADGVFKLQGFVYKMNQKSDVASLPGNYEVRVKSRYDFEKELFILKEGILTAPFGGPFQMNGQYNVNKNYLDEAYIKTESFRLEELPQHILFFGQVLPVNLGFSGESRLDLFVKGDPKKFDINAKIDSTQANLTYSKYFSKSSGVPFIFRSDLQLLVGTIIRGSFALEMDKASLKGSLVDWDLGSGRGEFTLLTNKFNLNGWEKYFSLFRNCALTGNVKFLFSAKGDLNRIFESQMMANASFDQLGLKTSNGAEIKNLTGAIDVGPLDSEMKRVNIQIGNSSFIVSGKMFARPARRWLIEFSSSEFNPRDLVQNLNGIADAVQSENLRINWSSLERSLSFVQPGEIFKNLNGQIVFGSERLLVPELTFNAYGGKVSCRTVIDFSKTNPSSNIDVDINRISLARIGRANEKPILEGNFFASSSLTSQGPIDEGWMGRLSGDGTFSITNGEFHTFDLLGGLGQIAQLALLNQYQSGSTKFNDIHSTFKVGQNKIETKDLFLVSEDFQVEAAGDIDFEGKLNYRLSIYLMPKLAQKFSDNLDANERLGPIPLLLIGTIDQPKIQKDPVLVQTFLDYFVRQQFSKIASRLTSVKQKNNEAQTTSEKPSEPSGDFKKALTESGFNFLEQFLSEKKQAQPRS